PSSAASQNANKSKSAAKTAKKPAPPAAASSAAKGGEQAAKTVKPPHHRKPAAKGAGVPKGVGACVDRLIKLAEKDPLVDYDKGPYEIINNGLLWDNAHSNCSVGNNADLRTKLFDVGTAWQQKDAGKVRSTLQDIKSAVPPSEEKPMAHKATRRHKAAAVKPAATGEAAAPAKTGAKKPAGKSAKKGKANANSAAK
ncbi:MAG: hypothetical protein ACREDR_00575, partial [Blastocatellia bacterium]